MSKTEPRFGRWLTAGELERCKPGSVTDAGGGIFCVTLTAGNATGTDRLRVTVDDGVRPVVLMPDPAIVHKTRQALTRIAGKDLGIRTRTWKRWAHQRHPELAQREREAQEEAEAEAVLPAP